MDGAISSGIKHGFQFDFEGFGYGLLNGWFMKWMWMLENDRSELAWEL